MTTRADDPFAEDELTAEELALLEQDTTNLDDIPSDDDLDVEADDQGADGKPPRPDAKAEPEPDKEPEQDADDDMRAFMQKHQGKSPEELLRLAYQQNQARKEARHTGKEAQEKLASLVERLNQSRAEREKAEAERKAQFEKELAEDPDAATKRLHDELLTRDQQQAEQREWQEYITQQTELTRNYIPDFDAVQPEIFKYAVEELGFAPEQVMAASDYREIVMANHSRMFSNLVRQGVVDQAGNLLVGGQAPSGASDTIERARAAQQQTAPRSMSDVRGQRQGAGRSSLVKQAEELLSKDDLSVSDDDLDALLRELG